MPAGQWVEGHQPEHRAGGIAAGVGQSHLGGTWQAGPGNLVSSIGPETPCGMRCADSFAGSSASSTLPEAGDAVAEGLAGSWRS